MRQRRGRFRVTCFRLQEISWDQRKTLRDERSYRQGVFISRPGKLPSGLMGTSLLKPDGVSLIPWCDGKPIAWDATVATTLAESYVSASATLAGSAAELAASKKMTKYSGLGRGILFQPVSFESLGPASGSTAAFVTQLGKRISAVSV